MIVDFIVGCAIALNAALLSYAVDMYLTEQQIELAPLLLTVASIAALIRFSTIKED